MRTQSGSLERAIEVALSAGLVVSTAFLIAGLLLGVEWPLRFGIVFLMFTPVVRVVIVSVGLLHERDWLFAGLSLFVLGVLVSGMIVAARL